MSWKIIELASVAASPWRNGGGMTRELAAWPKPDDWTWRMSVAEVDASGAFSTFDGVDRWFAVLSGAGVRLDMAGSPAAAGHTLTTQSAPLLFDGGLATHCELLGGKTRDFNLMVRADRAESHMQRLQGAAEVELELTLGATEIIAIYAHETGARARFGTNSADLTDFEDSAVSTDLLDLPAGCLAWRQVTRRTTVHIFASSALVMEIQP